MMEVTLKTFAKTNRRCAAMIEEPHRFLRIKPPEAYSIRRLQEALCAGTDGVRVSRKGKASGRAEGSEGAE